MRYSAISASLDLGSSAISDSSGHKVDGSSESVPTVTELSLNGPCQRRHVWAGGGNHHSSGVRPCR